MRLSSSFTASTTISTCRCAMTFTRSPSLATASRARSGCAYSPARSFTTTQLVQEPKRSPRFLILVRSSVGLFALLTLAGCASPPSRGIAKDSERRQIRIVETLNCNQLLHYVRPVYPKEAKRRRIEGTVTLRAIITKTGEIRDVEVLKGDPLLIPSALSAVKQWRYAPCIINSDAVEIRTSFDIDFNLSQ